VSRSHPLPPRANTLHVVGDTQAISSARAAMVSADFTRPTVPDVPYRVQVGDLIGGTGEPSLFPAAIALLDSMGTGQWWACVGNHDYDYQDGSPGPADAAASMGMPGLNFTVDLGYAMLIVSYVRVGVSLNDPNPYDPTWLDEQLTEHAGRTCLIAAHGPLEHPDEGGPHVPEADEIMAVLAEHDNAKAWLHGHTHTVIDHPRLVMPLDVGGRTIAHINGSATYYTDPDVDWTDRLCTTWLTVEPDWLEVRFRDHGAHQWIGGGPSGSRVWTYPLL